MHLTLRWIPASGANEAHGGMKTKSKVAIAAPVAPAAGLKRINLAGIATQSPAAKATKTYPSLPDPDGQVAALVEGILEKSEQLEAIEGALEIEKTGPAIVQFFMMRLMPTLSLGFSWQFLKKSVRILT